MMIISRISIVGTSEAVSTKPHLGGRRTQKTKGTTQFLSGPRGKNTSDTHKTGSEPVPGDKPPYVIITRLDRARLHRFSFICSRRPDTSEWDCTQCVLSQLHSIGWVDLIEMLCLPESSGHRLPGSIRVFMHRLAGNRSGWVTICKCYTTQRHRGYHCNYLRCVLMRGGG